MTLFASSSRKESHAHRFLPAVALLSTPLFAQSPISVSLTNILRYGTGTEQIGSVSNRRDYFENLTEARLTFEGLLIGFRLLHDAPPEYGVEFSGIQKRYVEFRKDNFYIRAGHSYSLFGRGLALNLFENRLLAFDTALDGIKAEYNTPFANFAITGGDIEFTDPITLSRTEHYRVRGGSVEFLPLSSFSVGLNFISGKSRFPNSTPDQDAKFDMPEFFGTLQLGPVGFFASYTKKRTAVHGANRIHKGTAVYASLSYTAEAFGVSVEYKDYRFGIADPFERYNSNRATRALAFQNAPIVIKEHSFSLLTRYPHVVDFNDEVGFQTDIFYSPIQQLTVSLNGSMASRHHSYVRTGIVDPFTFLPLYRAEPRRNSYLPRLDSRFSPYWETYAEIQYYLEKGGTDFILLGLNRRSDEIADETTQMGPTIDPTRVTAVPLSIQYTVSGPWVAKLIAERQWVFEGKNGVTPRYSSQLVSLSVSHSPEFSVGVRHEFTTDRGTVDKRKDWTAIDVSYRISRKHSLTLVAGSDRGGQVCANGICRFVNPFLGFRAGIVSYF